jgi:hypothetical protein
MRGDAQRPRCQRASQPRLAAHDSHRARQHEARGQPERGVVDDRQRMRPFLDEAQAGIDHRGAIPEREGEHQCEEGQQRRVQRHRRTRRSGEGPRRHHEEERGQHDHLARHPRGAPHQRGAPGTRGVPEMEERCDQRHDQERGCDAERDRHGRQARGRPGQARERDHHDQPLGGTRKRREQQEGPGRPHVRPSSAPATAVRAAAGVHPRKGAALAGALPTAPP